MDDAEGSELRPIASVDLAIFALAPTGLEVLLMRRGAEPFAGSWALPGGFVHVGEDADLEAAARRVLEAKTGVETPYLEQLQTFGNAGRDPRGWSLSIAYVALIAPDAVRLRQGANAADVAWWPLVGDSVAEPLAFDHAEILNAALARVRSKVEYTTLPVHLLPEGFTLSELQSVYERILGRRLDKSAFRKRVAEADFVEPIPGAMRRASNRPAQLYRLKQGRSTVFFIARSKIRNQEWRCPEQTWWCAGDSCGAGMYR
jgi:ADP-ribose pyrophosphatase YjhB (NUDIX family)